jgi:hypothetical protein
MTEDLRRGADGEMVAAETYHSNAAHWMGAFERVMGDERDQYHNDSRPNRKTQRRSADLDDPSDVVRSAAPSPFKNGEDDYLSERSRNRRGSIGTSSIDVIGPTRPVASRSHSSYVGHKKEKNSSGSLLVDVSPTESILMEDVYLNHAPGMHPLHIRNVSNEKRVLLRLGSDLDRGLVFLRRKRSGPVCESQQKKKEVCESFPSADPFPSFLLLQTTQPKRQSSTRQTQPTGLKRMG